MEFLVLASGFRYQRERERIVMNAVIEAAENIGARRVMKRRGNVYGTSVYIKDGKTKTLLYNDWDKNWGWKEIHNRIIASIRASGILTHKIHHHITVAS